MNESNKATKARNEANHQLEQALIEKQQRLELEKNNWIRQRTTYQNAEFLLLIKEADQKIDSLNQRITENEVAIKNLKKP